MKNTPPFAAFGAFLLLISLTTPIFAEGESSWYKKELTDPMNDKTRIVFWTPSLSAPACASGAARAGLQLICASDLSVMLSAEGCVFDERSVFSYRIDKRESGLISTDALSSGQAIEISDLTNFSRSAPNFVTEIMTGEKLIIEITPYATAAEILEFDISGLKSFVADDFKGCFPSAYPAEQGITSSNKELRNKGLQQQSLTGPRAASSIENQILEELSCTRLPMPSPIFETLRQQGKISFDRNEGADSASCFVIEGGLSVVGVTLTSICGFEEDEETRKQYPGLYTRGPGTSPGQFISFGVAEQEPLVRKWYSGNFNASNVDQAVNSDFVNLGASTEITCSSWMVRP